ncbi:MAG TPA: biotin/lipoyl-binding protein, partial [Verrucomicrobia bacterium]|nr:biotin/lipoyl-binding protein [Verrucomicrobiota bacterium]
MKSDDIFPETEKTTIPLGNNWRCLACFTSATLSWLPGSLLTLHSQPSPQTVQRVEVGQVDELRITKDLEVIGSLEPFLEIEISSQAQGLIISMPVDEGKRVSKGDLLFELDALAEEIALRRAKAELEKSQTELRKLKAGYLPQEIEEARKRVNANEAINAAAEDGWKRIQRLEEQGIVSARELIKAQTDLEVTRSQVSQSSARLLLLEQGYRNEDIQIAAAEVKVQQALVAGIEKRIADTRIEAPAAGVIVTRLKDLAEWTNSGERVLVMVVDNEMKLRIEVPQKNVPSI